MLPNIIRRRVSIKLTFVIKEFYTYPSPDYVWQHDMSKPSEEFIDMKTNVMKKISVLPQPYQKPYPPIHQVVDGIRSIEWAAQQGLNIIMWIPTVKALKIIEPFSPDSSMLTVGRSTRRAKIC